WLVRPVPTAGPHQQWVIPLFRQAAGAATVGHRPLWECLPGGRTVLEAVGRTVSILVERRRDATEAHRAPRGSRDPHTNVALPDADRFREGYPGLAMIGGS